MPARSLSLPTAFPHVAVGCLPPTCPNGYDGGLDIRPVLHTPSRGVSLPGAEPHADLTSLSPRFIDLGLMIAQALPLREVRRRYVGPRELLANLLTRPCIQVLELFTPFQHLNKVEQLPSHVETGRVRGSGSRSSRYSTRRRNSSSR